MTKSDVLCQLTDIPDGGAISAVADGDELILLRRGDQVYAYHNECPHAGRRLDWAPGQFLVKEGRITCAVHGATFAVDSGECLGGPCRAGLVAIALDINNGVIRKI